MLDVSVSILHKKCSLGRNVLLRIHYCIVEGHLQSNEIAKNSWMVWRRRDTVFNGFELQIEIYFPFCMGFNNNFRGHTEIDHTTLKLLTFISKVYTKKLFCLLWWSESFMHDFCIFYYKVSNGKQINFLLISPCIQLSLHKT